MLLLHFMSTGEFCRGKLKNELTHPQFPVLLVMRVYALYMRNKWVLGILVFEIAAAEALGCVSASSYDKTVSFYSW
jgi:hypothetical protein